MSALVLLIYWHEFTVFLILRVSWFFFGPNNKNYESLVNWLYVCKPVSKLDVRTLSFSGTAVVGKSLGARMASNTPN